LNHKKTPQIQAHNHFSTKKTKGQESRRKGAVDGKRKDGKWDSQGERNQLRKEICNVLLYMYFALEMGQRGNLNRKAVSNKLEMTSKSYLPLREFQTFPANTKYQK